MIFTQTKNRYFVRLCRFILETGIAGLILSWKYRHLNIFFIPLILPIVTEDEINLEVPINTCGHYTEEEILLILLDWVKIKHPKKFYDYLFENNNQKKQQGATDLLWLRLREEPSWLFLLPDHMLERIGVKVNKNFSPDAKLDSLVKAIHANQIKEINLKLFLEKISKQRTEGEFAHSLSAQSKEES